MSDRNLVCSVSYIASRASTIRPTRYQIRFKDFIMKTKIFGCLIILSLLMTGQPWSFAASGSSAAGSIEAVTMPSADVTLSFIQSGRIDKINYREGETVKVGDNIVQQYDIVERAQLAQLEADSLNVTQIQATEAKLKQAKVDFERRKNAPKSTTQSELDNAELNMNIAELSMRLAVFQHEQAIRKFEEAKLKIDNMTMKSPIDGRIEEIYIEAGESVNALDKVVRVVRIDPLWIDVHVPLAQSVNLNYGNAATVEFTGAAKSTVEGIIIFKAAVADSASDTLKVRIQAPNGVNRPAGEQVKVTFVPQQGRINSDTTKKN
jgi:membrane fusion protein, multidrug efflux system